MEKKLSFTTNLYLTQYLPGILRVIFRTLADNAWNIERVWSGEAFKPIHVESLYGSIRISKFASLSETADSIDTIKNDLERNINTTLSNLFEQSERPRVEVVEIVKQDRFQFSLQVEVNDHRGVVKDIFRTIFRPGIYSNDKEAIFQILICLFLPLYTRGKNNVYIVDVRFRALIGEEANLNHFANIDDLQINTNESSVCRKISQHLKLIPGVLKWSLLATHRRTEPIVDQSDIIESFDSHRYPHSHTIRFDRVVHSYGYPGVAYAVAEFLYDERYSIYRGNVSEFITQGYKRNIAYLRGEPTPNYPGENTVPNDDVAPPSEELIGRSIEKHINSLIRYNIALLDDLPGEAYIAQSYGVGDYTEKIWISCQIEVHDKLGNLALILECIDSEMRRCGIVLSVEHLANMYLYLVNENSLVEILFTLPCPVSDEEGNGKIARYCSFAICNAISEHVDGIIVISCKPVRSYGIKSPVERWVNYKYFQAKVIDAFDENIFTVDEQILFGLRSGINEDVLLQKSMHDVINNASIYGINLPSDDIVELVQNIESKFLDFIYKNKI